MQKLLKLEAWKKEDLRKKGNEEKRARGRSAQKRGTLRGTGGGGGNWIAEESSLAGKIEFSARDIRIPVSGFKSFLSATVRKKSGEGGGGLREEGQTRGRGRNRMRQKRSKQELGGTVEESRRRRRRRRRRRSSSSSSSFEDSDAKKEEARQEGRKQRRDPGRRIHRRIAGSSRVR